MIISLLMLVSIPEDVPLHVAGSAIITAATYTTCRAVFDGSKTTCRIVAIAASATAGIAKEIADTHNTGPEHAKDLGSDALGTGLGLLISIPF